MSRFDAQDKRIRGCAGLPKSVVLLPSERAALRRNRIALATLDLYDPAELHDLTGIAVPVCEMLVSLMRFQQLESVGPETALDLCRLGLRTMQDLAAADPVVLFERLKVLTRSSQDPCVEDSLRCAIAQARHEDLPPEMRKWWSYSKQRGQHDVYIPRRGMRRKGNRP